MSSEEVEEEEEEDADTLFDPVVRNFADTYGLLEAGASNFRVGWMTFCLLGFLAIEAVDVS